MGVTDNTVTVQLGQGCYMTYDEVSNGFGGRHPVRVVFYNEEGQFTTPFFDKQNKKYVETEVSQYKSYIDWFYGVK